MRLLGTLTDEQLAVRFWNYLESQKISSRLDRDADGFHIWVISEDDVPPAKVAYQDYLTDPKNSKFNADDKLTAELKRIRLESEKRNKMSRARQRRLPWQTHEQREFPVTIMLVVISVTLTLLTNFGATDNQLREFSWIDSRSYSNVMTHQPLRILPDITEKFQVWRLVSPIFLHLSLPHLVFNMIVTLQFGMMIERRKGSIFLFLQVLFIAVTSNLVQFYFSQSSQPSFFGGMSGVCYGFFGFLWMKGVVSPEEGLGVQQQTIFIMLVWFAICMFSIGIANYAHAIGLFLGMFLGAAPGIYRGRRRRIF